MEDSAVIKTQSLIAILDEKSSDVTGTYVCEFHMSDVTSEDQLVGNDQVSVPHIFAVKLSDEYLIRDTSTIINQVVILHEMSDVFLVSSPSSMYRPT